MIRLRKFPLFAAVTAASAVACAAQGWLIHASRERARRAEIQLEAKRQERDWLAHRSPALTAENARAIEADLALAERRLVELRASFAGRPWLATAPAQPVEAHFAVAAFAKRMRALAAQQRVALRSEENFGFATCANAGPSPELLGAVHRQRVVLEHLLEALFEARPDALIAVARERPLSAAQRAARRAGDGASSEAGEASAASEVAEDFFTPAERLRLAVAGVAESELFRVEFAGRTPALRSFLNALARSPLPVFVRAVEVAPEAAAPAEGTAPDAAVPLVAPAASRFAVTVECVELVPTREGPHS